MCCLWDDLRAQCNNLPVLGGQGSWQVAQLAACLGCGAGLGYRVNPVTPPEVLYNDLLYVSVLCVQLLQQQQVRQSLLTQLTEAYQNTCK
jgi:hypothetical protein